MKLETLSKVLERLGRLKLFVATQHEALTVYVSKPEPAAEGLTCSFATDTALRVNFDTMAISFDPYGTDRLVLAPTAQFTRRIQTHRRHVESHQLPSDYFQRAADL